MIRLAVRTPRHKTTHHSLPHPKLTQRSRASISPLALRTPLVQPKLTITVQLKHQQALPTDLQERINRIEGLIRKNWEKYIDAAKFKSPLRTRVKLYENKN
jgi:hypothetical protein